MGLVQCQAFLKFLRAQKVLGEPDVQRVIKQYGAIDRRFGQLAALYGVLKAESIPQILEFQSRDSDKRFGECAIAMNLTDDGKTAKILRIQNDDLFLFAQAAVLLKFLPMAAMLKHLAAFQAANPVQSPEKDGGNEEDQKETISRTKKVLRGINSIAPLPPTAAKAMSMLNDANCDLDKLGHVLSVDPSFVGMLLKMVNSAFYGLKSRISSVKNALVILGLEKLRQLVLAAAVMDKFKNLPPDVTARFWEHAVWTGEWCKQLGNQFKFAETDEMFIAGILHNVGELLAYQHFPAEQAQIDMLTAAGKSRLDAERLQLGGTHADLGSYLFGLWKLPDNVLQSTLLHHHDLGVLQAMPDVKPQSVLVHMAATLSSLDPSLDSFAQQKELENTFNAYQGFHLQLPGMNSVRINMVYDRIASAVNQILGIFQK